MIQDDIEEIKTSTNILEMHNKVSKLVNKIDTMFYVDQKLLGWERDYLQDYLFKITCSMDWNFACKELKMKCGD